MGTSLLRLCSLYQIRRGRNRKDSEEQYRLIMTSSEEPIFTLNVFGAIVFIFEPEQDDVSKVIISIEDNKFDKTRELHEYIYAEGFLDRKIKIDSEIVKDRP